VRYLIRRATSPPAFRGEWDGPAWGGADVLEVSHFHPRSSDHRPRTRAKLLHDDAGVYVLFHVADRYVRSVQTAHQSHVYRDSCVEFFVQPKPGSYFNVEFNCGGTMLLYHLKDPPRGPSGKLEGHSILTPQELATIRVFHSLPKMVPVEIAEPVEWTLEYFLPYALMERYVGPLESPLSRRWRANFYKCGDDTTHPHWASWSPIERLDFHQPNHFAPLVFDVGAVEGALPG
jgi:hypothetical protein